MPKKNKYSSNNKANDQLPPSPHVILETEQNKSHEENAKKIEILKIEDKSVEVKNSEKFENVSSPLPNAISEYDNEHFTNNTSSL